MREIYFDIHDGRRYKASRNRRSGDPRRSWDRVSIYVVPDYMKSSAVDVSEISEGLLAEFVEERKRTPWVFVDEIVDRVNDENRKYAKFPGKRLYLSSVTDDDRTALSDVVVVVETDLPEEMVWEYTKVFGHWLYDRVWTITDVSKNVLEEAVYAHTPQEALKCYFKRVEVLDGGVA